MEAVAEITAAVKNVPVLRFSEFEGEWLFEKFGSLADFKNGLNFGKDQEGSGLKVIGVGDFKDFLSIPYNQLSQVNVPESQKSAYLLRDNDILFVRSNGNKDLIGRALFINHIEEEVSYSGFTIRARFNEGAKDIYPLFYAYFFRTAIPKKQFSLLGGGTNISNLNQEILSGLLLPKPSYSEQQKIASFLSAADEKIQQLSKKKALLEKYKKGVMQQIFSQQIRFKDDNGNAYPEWEEKKLGEVFEFYTTNSYSRSLLNYDEGSVKNIHYGDIHTKFKSNFDITKEKVPFINEDVDVSRIAESSFCQVGDLIIADASEDYKDIGKAIEIINLNNEAVVAGLHTYIARDNYNAFALGFKGYLMQSRKVRLQMMRYATGVSVLGISKGNIAKVEIGLPVLEEQQKIVSFITSIDNKINYTLKQLEQAQQFKKGLLQQMFV